MFANRLIREKSPYLLQHAHNPVDWYPWGQEAFNLSKRENKPIFLSVGYATCHWCHVMEKESFENKDIAEFLNANFVNIKVDRESLPEVDKCYMKFVQATNRQAGWPMSVWLTPGDLKPFFGGTYFPPEDSYGRPGFLSICRLISSRWKENSDRIIASSNEIMADLQQSLTKHAADMPSLSVFEKAIQHFEGEYDSQYGGFGGEPKFPTTSILHMLLTYGRFYGTKSDNASDMVAHTLNCISKGGIHDHIGKGFHRYSTDRYWHVPHFEKMLYDQAQLLDIYCDAYKVFPDQHIFRNNAKDIIDYVSENLLSSSGGFYSAQDADSRESHDVLTKKEGAFAVWTHDELKSLLGSKSELFIHHFGVEKDGNVPSEKDPHGELVGKNVLFQKHSIEETAKQFNQNTEQVSNILKSCKENLAAIRKNRPPPDLDDKILLSWNALMISALTNAYKTFQTPDYLEIARKSLQFIELYLFNKETGELKRAFRDGTSFGECGCDDYAFFIRALIDFHQSSFESKWIEWAKELQLKQDSLFWDNETGGYYSSKPDLVLRTKDAFDAAEPSSNSIALMNLLRLHSITSNDEYKSKAESLIRVFSLDCNRYPHSMPRFLEAYMIYTKGITHISFGENVSAEMKNEIFETYLPECVVEQTEGGVVIICRNNVCEEPIRDRDTLESRLL